MTPFLFLIVAEGLNGVLKRAVKIDKFRGFIMGVNSGLAVSMVQFADDTLFFGEATQQNVATLKCVLRSFELASGLKVNFFKSKLIGVAVEDRILRNLASSLHCKAGVVPFKYLGLTVEGNPRRISFWEPVITRVKKRLAALKNKCISFGGRICLIKSILTSIPLYFLSFYKAPVGVVKACHRIMRNFLWGGSEDTSKIAWVNWEQVCSAKGHGGLGLRD